MTISRRLDTLAQQVKVWATQQDIYTMQQLREAEQFLDILDGAYTDRVPGEAWPAEAEKLRSLLWMLSADLVELRRAMTGANHRATMLAARLTGEGDE